MAAFSSVVALEQLLNQQLTSNQLPDEELRPLIGQISSLKSSLDKIFPAKKKERGKANDLAVEVRQKVFEAQDAIEEFIYNKNQPAESQSSTAISLKEIEAKIEPTILKAKEMGDSKKDGNELQPDDKAQTFKSSENQKTRIIGQEKYKADIEKKLTADVTGREVIPISGMAGIGKTTLAKSIYDDPKIKDQFQYRAWVTVSQDYNVGDILGKLLNSLESRGQKAGDKLVQGTEEQLRVQLHQALHNNKYLVVVDDMWDEQIWLKLKLSLPDNENRSRVLLTTRILNVAKAVGSVESLEMQPLNEEDSWTLLRIRTFGDDEIDERKLADDEKKVIMKCPPELEPIGRIIANNCKGLPLSLTVIGGLLSQGRKEVDYWKVIEEDTFAATHDVKLEDAYLGILSLSYDHLPSKLKGCFLYMGAFPEDSDIPVSKVVRLWVAEGFLTMPPPPRPKVEEQVAELSLEAAAKSQPPPPLVEKVAEQSLLDLIDRNLVIIRRNRSNGKIRSCGVHDSIRDLAEKESGRDYFFHLRKRYRQDLDDNTNDQRRVSVHKNILMCLEEVFDKTKTITNARSLLYVGPHHHHPIPFSLTFDLLRVLDAFTVYFIQFPDEILRLVHLRYLAFTYNGKIPVKLTHLEKLQVLLVRRQPKIIFIGTPFLPDEIWKMEELRHLLITETDLPALYATEPGTILFEKLQTLTNVNAESCTEEVLGHMPNLKRLAMWIEGPGDCGLFLHKVEGLEIFKFVVLNPIPGKPIKFQPKLYFPKTVRKLFLTGCGLPWEDMDIIAELPNLEVMKLKEMAFHGKKWTTTKRFDKLKYLLIEYLNLETWAAKHAHFPVLEQLYFRHCYELEEIKLDMGELGYIKVLELVDCSPKAVEWAEEVKANAETFESGLQVHIYSSWE